ncbi:Uncharacterised protein [Serratia grimesii]|nr:Uncharacterised protein [Serratia grimesii]SMZ56650.1 Uncharacterised protein [Serratia grimesii]
MTNPCLSNLAKEPQNVGMNITQHQRRVKLRGWENLNQVDQKHPSSQEEDFGHGGMEIKAVKFMSGTHGMVSWKDIVPVMVNTWVPLIQKLANS